MKLTSVIALVLATVFGLSSCSLFGGKKKRTTRLSEATLLPSSAPQLGSGGPSLGGAPRQSRH